jgi:signal transduction histidine kinase
MLLSGRNSAQFQGSGLGLAIVKRIIDLHHGTIHVKTSGEGTTFMIRLPAGRSENNQ